MSNVSVGITSSPHAFRVAGGREWCRDDLPAVTVAESRSPRTRAFCEADAVERIAPIFAVRDLDAAMRHYQRLGFAVRAYAPGGYGFATWHGH